MRYLSTRGGPEAANLAEALRRGAPTGGGQFTPGRWPVLEPAEVGLLAGRGFGDIAAAVIGLFGDETISTDTLEDAVREAGAMLAHAAGAPLVELYPNVWLSERMHGPSGAPADFELQALARICASAGVRRVILPVGANEADAAVDAFASREAVQLFALTTGGLNVGGAPNVHALRMAGDGDALAAEAGSDETFMRAAGGWAITAADPLRPILRATFFAAAAARLGSFARPVDFACPAEDGALLVSAWIAKHMGFPVGRVQAVGPENALTALIAAGRVSGRPGPTPAGLERLYFEAVERQGLETGRAVQALERLGALDLAPRARAALTADFQALALDPGHVQAAQLAIANETGRALSAGEAGPVAAAREAASRSGRPCVVLSGPRLSRQDAAIAPEAQVAGGIADAEALKAAIRTLAEVGRAA